MLKLRFKQQSHQTDAVRAVVRSFEGQTRLLRMSEASEDGGFPNAPLTLSTSELLRNIQAVQASQGLPVSSSLASDSVAHVHLDIEMETGTGKTYAYIKTMFELNREYGFRKFIVVVPSVAIREGVLSSFEATAEHFLETYGKRARSFVYHSRQLHNLEAFSSDAGLSVMIINVQAFNARGEDARRIYLELDELQSRRPIDLLKKTRPILILDEPQKMEGGATSEKLAEFEPLFLLRYSATHKTERNKIYRLDAVDAFRQKLVKKIAVRGITMQGQHGTAPYLYFESLKLAAGKAPEARIELERSQNGGPRRVLRTLQKGGNLHMLSGELERYRGYVVSDVDALDGTVTFTNGVVLSLGEAVGDESERSLRRLQIRETIRAHFEKERLLFSMGIKVLSLFFIDEVAKYRSYDETGEKAGEYARVFEEEYAARLEEVLREFSAEEDADYFRYWKGLSPSQTHSGYFSIDKKTKRLVNPGVKTRGEGAGEADDVEAYDLILRDKSRLLSLEEPVRFLFSHSALREGWDNPNVFAICTLKHSDSTVSRRQEIGRGMRLAVTQTGDRVDDPALVHEVNVLTVVANESYRDFVAGLQKEFVVALARPGETVELPTIEDERKRVRSLDETRELQERVRNRNSGANALVALDSEELVRKSLLVLESELRVAPRSYSVSRGEQTDAASFSEEKGTQGPALGAHNRQRVRFEGAPPHPGARYDLLGMLAEATGLTRRTLAALLSGLSAPVFAQYQSNPEEFLRKTAHLVNGAKAKLVERSISEKASRGASGPSTDH